MAPMVGSSSAWAALRASSATASKARSGRWRLTGGRGLVGGLVQLLLAAPLLIAVLFDALGHKN
ncbi:hypothetical protein AS594_37475 [Streptomyces agglomeratus]|uniref:Uncharacterized protein n=1 Tax=Streptomyces agglomeratus TaxID=285458 RepID=A0A1E5NYC3_9ACTN|nr:hypothetical protein [Streptomyces agglomeratus]OEJ21298.1 hypothetical protein AS594_37475 [Streptomyces agglomeratus]